MPAGAAPAEPTQSSPDAELIELGARFEPLVDLYYTRRKRWAGALVAAHSEQDRRFGTRAERDCRNSPEIAAASNTISEHYGVGEADEALSAVHREIEKLERAINSLPATSIEGLRAKALISFWEVAPLRRLHRVFIR